jgi:hypothetical protein
MRYVSSLVIFENLVQDSIALPRRQMGRQSGQAGDSDGIFSTAADHA